MEPKMLNRPRNHFIFGNYQDLIAHLLKIRNTKIIFLAFRLFPKNTRINLGGYDMYIKVKVLFHFDVTKKLPRQNTHVAKILLHHIYFFLFYYILYNYLKLRVYLVQRLIDIFEMFHVQNIRLKTNLLRRVHIS